MDVKDFIEHEKPSGRRLSRIAPFLEQVLRLKADGYSDDQVRAFLAANGVRVTQPTISRFVSKHRNQMKKPESQAAQEKTVVDKPIKPINTDKSSGLSEIGTRLSAKTETRTIADFLSEIDELNNADNASK